MSATAFWAGEFGVQYHQRDMREVSKTVSLFDVMLSEASGIKSAIEFGAGTGTNLEALKDLLDCKTVGIEVNLEAAARMVADVGICSSILESNPPKCDLAFTKGVLIHIPPEDLPAVYKKLYDASTKYVLVCEYFNPTPVEIDYRGHAGRLWKRDFAGEMMDMFPLDLLDYGFSYDRDPDMPGDNFNWFLMEKHG